MNIGRWIPIRVYGNVWVRKGVPRNLTIAARALKNPNLSERRKKYWTKRLDRYSWHWCHPSKDIRNIVQVQFMTLDRDVAYALKKPSDI
jgi:hypothetical protein